MCTQSRGIPTKFKKSWSHKFIFWTKNGLSSFWMKNGACILGWKHCHVIIFSQHTPQYDMYIILKPNYVAFSAAGVKEPGQLRNFSWLYDFDFGIKLEAPFFLQKLGRRSFVPKMRSYNWKTFHPTLSWTSEPNKFLITDFFMLYGVSVKELLRAQRVSQLYD